MSSNQQRPQLYVSIAVGILLGIFWPATSVAQFSSPTAVQIETMLEKLAAPQLDFPKGCSLTDYLDLIESHLRRHAPLSLTFISDDVELKSEAITSLDKVILPPLQIEAYSMTLMDQIDFVFTLTVDPDLTVVPQNGLLLVTSRAKADEIFETRTYSVLDLLNLETLPPPGSERSKLLQEKLQALVSVTMDHASATSNALWTMIDGEGGSLDVVNSQFVITQTNRAHRQIRKFLKSLGSPDPLSSANPKQQRVVSSNIIALQSTIKTLQVLAIIGWLVAITFAGFSFVLLRKLAASLRG